MALQYTKNRIYECALRMAEKCPVNKITVRAIVAECEITRNTFYYHFHDLVDVYVSFVDSKIDELLKRADTDTEAAFFDFIELAVSYKKVWLNLYKSVGHERLSKFVSEKTRRLIMMAISKAYDIEAISALDLEIICTFYEEAFFGIFMRWLKDSRFGTKDKLKYSLERIRVLFDGQLDALIKNSLEK